MIYLSISIDVEGVHGTQPFETMVLGKLPGTKELWGLEKILISLEEFSCKGVFYFDILESLYYGDRPIRSAIERILMDGHELGLHTHPSWRIDPDDNHSIHEMKRKFSFLDNNKDMMAKCTLEEQRNVIDFSCGLLSDWGVYDVTSHRSGGYSINQDTISVLEEYDFKVDSSMLWRHPNTKINLSINKPVKYKSLLELPVTVFERHQCIGIGRKCLYNRVDNSRKLDLDACSFEEFVSYLTSLDKHDDHFVNLFMHSYSLLDFDRTYSWFKPSEKKLEIFRSLLSWLEARDNVKVVTHNDFYSTYQESPLNFSRDYINTVLYQSDISDLAFKHMKNYSKRFYSKYWKK